MSSIAALFGRIFLAALFILQGAGKLMYQNAYNQSYANNPYLDWMAAPGTMAVPLGIFELVIGILILLGFMTRATALVAAIYAVLTAVYLHLANIAEPIHQQLLLMWLAIAGGLLMLFAYGNTRGSLDRLRRKKDDTVVVERDHYIERDPATGERVHVDTQSETHRVKH